jgi:uncharacterized protein DUF6852/uncharacterized protein DUF5606
MSPKPSVAACYKLKNSHAFMEYNKIIAVTGLPGLYELLSSKSDGAIVRSLEDKSTRFVASRVHNFSHLESIEVYTVRDNVNLVDVLKAMEASSEKLPDEKDNAALKAYFGKVYPDLDFDRVYSSDLRKMVKWFGVLQSNNIEIKLSEQEEAEATEETAETEETAPKETPKKKAAAAKEPSAAKEKAPAAKETAAREKEKAKAPAKEKKAKETEEEVKPKAKKTAAKSSTEKKSAAAEKPKKTTKKKS